MAAEGENVVKMNLTKLDMVCKLQVLKATARVLHNEEDMLDKVFFDFVVYS